MGQVSGLLFVLLFIKISRLFVNICICTYFTAKFAVPFKIEVLGIRKVHVFRNLGFRVRFLEILSVPDQ